MSGHREFVVDESGLPLGVLDHGRARDLGVQLAYEVAAGTNSVAAVREAVNAAMSLDPTGFPIVAAYVFESIAKHVLRPLLDNLSAETGRDYLNALTAIRDGLREQEAG